MSFPCKYEGVICIRCHQEIAIGSMIQFARKGSKDKEHETCPRASPPVAPSVRQGGRRRCLPHPRSMFDGVR